MLWPVTDSTFGVWQALLRSLRQKPPTHATFLMRIVAALVVLCLKPVVTSGQLVPIPEPPPFNTSPHEVTTLFFLDSVHGWVVVEDHEQQQFRLFRTVDGGKQWSGWEIPSGIFRVTFVNPKLGWALKLVQGKDPDDQTFYLLRTTDGGTSWKGASSKPFIESKGVWQGLARELAFADSRHGWIVGAGPPVIPEEAALIMQTTDGGGTVRRVVDIPKSLRASWGIFASREAGVWVLGEEYVIHSSDSGKTWEATSGLKPSPPYDLSPQSILFRPSGRGWLSGTSQKAVILGTEDFGKHWRKEIEIGDDLSIFDNLSSWDDDHACAIMNSDLFCTADGGSTWQQKKDVLVTSPGSGLITKLVILPSGRGWFLCQGGLLYETVDGGQTWTVLDLLDKATPAKQSK